ncbi:MAG: hypothetical protein ABW252_23510 [Polyangiales bacterium]
MAALATLFAPASPRARRVTRVVVAGITAVLAWLYLRELGGDPAFPVDDAYISLHNGSVFFRGSDDRFVGTPPLVGSTSAVHVVLSAIFQLVLSPVWAHWVVTMLGALAYALALLRLAFVLRASVLEALWMLLAAMLVAQTPHTLMNGLETGFALAGVTWALAAARDREGRAWELPVACGTLPFLRPELVAVSGLLMLIRVVRDYKAGGMRAALKSAGWFALAAAPWALLLLITTGAPFPNTVEAKKNFFSEGCRPANERLHTLVATFRGFRESIGYFAYAGALLLLLTLTGWTGLLFTAVFGWAYYTRFPGALSHYEQRYMYVLLPFLFYGVATLFSLRRALPRWIAAGLFGLCIVQAVPQVVPHWRFHLGCIWFTRVELDGAAKWLQANARGRKILLHDAGYVGAFVDARLADLVGLKTPDSIPDHRDLTWSTCGGGRGEAMRQIALREQPDFLVVLGAWDRIFGISEALRAQGWELTPRYEHEYIVFEVVRRPPHG